MVGATTPTNTRFNPLTRSDIDKQLKRMEYDLAEERVKPYIVDMAKELPEVLPLVSIKGSCICSVGNISAICGEAKSRKTFLTSGLVASAMAIPYNKLNNFGIVDKNHNLDVLWIDTEQGEMHVRKVVDRISEMTGAKLGGLVSEPRLTTLALRELSPHERKQRMYDAMMLMHYDLVVIDGIADLQRNTNDLEESDALVTELMALSTLAETHILCVLHTNPGSDKARGHLGSSLQRKAETVLFVHRVGETSVVEPQFCRNEPFERFAFAINEEGIPEVCELPMAEGSVERHPAVALLEDEYGGAIERATLINKLIDTQHINRGAAAMQVQRLITKGTLVVNGRMVQLPNITKSRNHAITGGGGDVINVIKCDTESEESEEIEGPQRPRDQGDREKPRTMLIASSLRSNDPFGPTVSKDSDHSDRETERPSEVADNVDSILPLVSMVSGSHGLEEKPVTSQPKQSMAAWDDDCPF